MNKIKKIIRGILVLFLIDIIAVVVYWALSTRYSADYNEHFDSGLVFFHSVTKRGDLSDESVKRCTKAMQLYYEKNLDNIICTGGLKTNFPRTGSKMMKDFLTAGGVNGKNIFADTLSHSSLSNWRESLKIIKEMGFKKILVISSPTHILRLKYICVEPGLYVKCVTFAPDSGIRDIFLDCNIEFGKWFFLLLLPESFSDWVKDLIR
ncbi:MAG: YdcF family protein [Ignavibacteria bacterium]|nr:YdcF family protein [Ignavibacteria bacterium]